MALSGDNDGSRSDGEDVRGYSYTHLVEILYAANATKSDVIFFWSKPDPYVTMFAGSDMEFVTVILPPVTQVCLDKRRPASDVCSANVTLRLGDPEGVCDFPPEDLNKLITPAIRTDLLNSKTAAAESPAFEMFNLFKMENPRLEDWFVMVNEKGALETEKRFLLREGTCAY